MVMWSALFGIFAAFMTWLAMQQDRARRRRQIEQAQARLDREREL